MRTIRFSTVVDLSHRISPDMPHWPGDPPTRFDPVATLERDGWFLRALGMGEHSGTHVNAPASFFAQGPGVDALNPGLRLLPAVVLDMAANAAADPDACLEPADVLAWEKKFGRVPQKSLVLVHTGWAAKWSDPAAFLGRGPDGALHFPGIGPEAAELLAVQRKCAGLGIDTHGLDPGSDDRFAANREILAAGGLALECLANLDRLPPVGATVITGLLKLKGGSGSPASVLALIP